MTRAELRAELLAGIDTLLHSRLAKLAMTETQLDILAALAVLYGRDDDAVDKLLAVLNEGKLP